jgi:hypothetical protein
VQLRTQALGLVEVARLAAQPVALRAPGGVSAPSGGVSSPGVTTPGNGGGVTTPGAPVQSGNSRNSLTRQIRRTPEVPANPTSPSESCQPGEPDESGEPREPREPRQSTESLIRGEWVVVLVELRGSTGRAHGRALSNIGWLSCILARRALGRSAVIDRVDMPPLGQQAAHFSASETIIDQIEHSAIRACANDASRGLDDLLHTRI